VRDAIIDAKGYIIFVDAYPELVDKNQVALQSLLTVAANRGVHAIKERLRTDAQYAAHLASLVSPLRVSIFLMF
jgi:DNA-binding protein YbaB